MKLEKETRALRQRVVELHEQIGLEQMTDIDVENIQNILYPNASEFEQEIDSVLTRHHSPAADFHESRNGAEMVTTPGSGTNTQTMELNAATLRSDETDEVSINSAQMAPPEMNTNAETTGTGRPHEVNLYEQAEDREDTLPSISKQNEDKFSGNLDFHNTVRQHPARNLMIN